MRISDWSSACALPIYRLRLHQAGRADRGDDPGKLGPTVRHPADLCGPCVDQFLELPWKEALRSVADGGRSEEHTSELQSLMRISYAVFCLKKKKPYNYQIYHT